MKRLFIAVAVSGAALLGGSAAANATDNTVKAKAATVTQQQSTDISSRGRHYRHYGYRHYRHYGYRSYRPYYGNSYGYASRPYYGGGYGGPYYGGGYGYGGPGVTFSFGGGGYRGW
ncbi:MAG: hypothetical protein JWP25_6870 [Bradyrhizobium sp.]|jgi:hypothetical protein|nr:hypothetical protein [Bradyrhizobium sp.]MEA2865850.1 hypothetical protein [Bradyrhizobium sp.]